MSSKSSRGQLVIRSSLLTCMYACGRRGDHLDDLRRACVTSVTWPLTRSSVELSLRPPSPLTAMARVRFERIVETTQGRPGDLEGTPSPAPQRLWTGAQGSQGPSVPPATRGTPLVVYYHSREEKGVNYNTSLATYR